MTDRGTRRGDERGRDPGRRFPRGIFLRVALLTLASLAAGCGAGPIPWETATPASQGLDAERLARWAASLEAAGTRSLMVLHNDVLIVEMHVAGRSRHHRHHIASMTKGVVGGVAIAVLVEDGLVDLDAPVAARVPNWEGAPPRSEITLRQLASHTAGIHSAKVPGLSKDQLTGWKADFWKHRPERSPVHVAVEDAPIVFPPGRGFGYSGPGFGVLSLVLASALEGAPSDSVPELLNDRVFGPIGIEESAWSIGPPAPFRVGATDVWPVWGGAGFTPDALLRLGRLLLRRGDWNGKQVLSPLHVEAMLTAAPRPPGGAGASWPAGAVGWWTNANGVWPELPRDTFLAAGSSHQILLVAPSLDLVLVRLGEPLGEDKFGGDFWSALHRELLRPLAQAFPDPPVARSETLPGAWFSPQSSVTCRARGSDNWPITWGADGLFASYGDGRGFLPHVSKKLSLGFATLTGDPDDFRGENLRSATGELVGNGPSGGKTSGMLSVDGVLYMLVRNLANSRLAWSDDDGASWTWGFRFEESFGSPTFLQFGRDYSGARDAYVYVYSQDGASAYEPDDAVVLARVHRDRIRDRAAWQFFAGSGRAGEPRWSREIDARRPVFAHPGHCLRSEVVYVGGLERYLMALGFDRKGGWGIFEAPEPWGPWRTVYLTPRWDVGDTHSYRMPTAWIHDAGRTLHLVYSGSDRPGAVLDAFCVRRLRIPDLEIPFALGSSAAASER
ncbi:MAG: serine hydrolase [Proteobacteria bacterium]|nr:serine hydrolase [Pseudomonadota bacterium]